jgi:hypothetical protein|tara:strand:- start:475 stop:660 length:186 start_codon:yes stop_codon:yes gene_type:complete
MSTKIQGEIKVVNQRLDTIENNHLVHLREDIKSVNQKIWAIVVLAIAQLCSLVLIFLSQAI